MRVHDLGQQRADDRAAHAGSAAHRAARKLTSPAFAYVYEPTREVGRMTGSGVAIAWIAVPPRIVFTAGVVTIPRRRRTDRQDPGVVKGAVVERFEDGQIHALSIRTSVPAR